VEAIDILSVCRRLKDTGHREQAHRIKRDPTPDLKVAIDERHGTFVVHCALKLSPYLFCNPLS
ncbi:MAG: hypothetical protein Q9M44_08095, partial [Ghiorsea sp.]|nr:hypothetical protein [Ghiorsea sp.]